MPTFEIDGTRVYVGDGGNVYTPKGTGLKIVRAATIGGSADVIALRHSDGLPLRYAKSVLAVAKGQYGYRFVPDASVDSQKVAMTNLASLIAAADLGVEPPAIGFFKEAGTAAPDFRWDSIHGCCVPASETGDAKRAVFVNADDPLGVCFETAAHEVAHVHQAIIRESWKNESRELSRDRGENEAADYGRQARRWFEKCGLIEHAENFSMVDLSRGPLPEDGDGKLAIGYTDDGRLELARYTAGKSLTGRWERITDRRMAFWTPRGA